MKNIVSWSLLAGAGIAAAILLWPQGDDALVIQDVSVYHVEETPEQSGQQLQEEDEQGTSLSESAAQPELQQLPESVQLDVPFTSQAPHGNWVLPYKEACEEVSMLMAARYIQGRTIAGADEADAAILELTDFTESEGFPVDTTAQETATLLTDFYSIETEVVEGVDWKRIKRELASGNPIIIPAAGKELGNPNFTPPGPPYHMLVLTGYTPTGVITNDPGTRNGEGYVYEYAILEQAIHDWNDGDVENGAQRFIVVNAE